MSDSCPIPPRRTTKLIRAGKTVAWLLIDGKKVMISVADEDVLTGVLKQLGINKKENTNG